MTSMPSADGLFPEGDPIIPVLQELAALRVELENMDTAAPQYVMKAQMLRTREPDLQRIAEETGTEERAKSHYQVLLELARANEPKSK